MDCLQDCASGIIDTPKGRLPVHQLSGDFVPTLPVADPGFWFGVGAEFWASSWTVFRSFLVLN